MSLTQKRWILLAIGCLINLCAGSIYAWSVFAAPLAERLAAITQTTLTAADLATAFSLANGLSPIPMILGGYFNDKLGPRRVIMMGGALIGLGLVLSGLAQSVQTLILVYGIFYGLGLGLTYGCVISNAVKFFPDHRGLIGGLTTAVYGASSVIIPPIANVLIANVGISQTMIIIGIAFAVIIVTGGFLSERCPDNFRPEGWTSKETQAIATRNYTWSEMLKTRTFYLMIALLMCGATAGMMMFAQAATIAREQMGFTAAAAATVVSLLAFFNMSGRLVAGYLSDIMGRLNTLGLALVFSAAGLFTLSAVSAGDQLLFIAAFCALGIAFGAFLGVFPGFTADAFGTAFNSVNYGIMFCGFSAAGIIGPNIMRVMPDYTSAYLCALAITAAGFIFFAALKLFNKKQ